MPVGAAADESVAAALKAWDPDKDGTLDLAEVKKAAEAKFDRLVKDKGGVLDRKAALGLGLRKAEIRHADRDNDDTLDKAEFMSIVEARFKAANPDADGTLDAKELKSKAGQALLRLLK